MKDKSPVIFEKKTFIQHYLQLWTNKYFHSCILNYYQNIVSFYKQQKNKHTVSRNGFYLTRMSSL